MSGILAIVLRDLKLAWQTRLRILLGLLQPLVYLFFLGPGLGGTTPGGSEHFMKFIFPGVIVLSTLFNGVVVATSIVFDRERGFLRAVLVAPVSRLHVVAAKVGSGALIAFLQGLLLLLFAPLIGLYPPVLRLVYLSLALALSTTAFSALGVAFAARIRRTDIFPIFVNAVLLPMYFLSAALFPFESAPGWLRLLVSINPVGHAVNLMRGSFSGHFTFQPLLSVCFLVIFIAFMVKTAIRAFQRGDDL